MTAPFDPGAYRPLSGGQAEVQLKHHFDAAHRLPHLAIDNNKCANLHGHTWGVTLSITGPIQPDMTIVEFGGIKKAWRAFIDQYLDHGTLLGHEDPLLPILDAHSSKVYAFGLDPYTEDLPWPSVEAVTTMLVRVAHALTLPDSCHISGMHVTETAANAVQWRPS